MATLTYNASITPSRQITITAGTGGSLTGSMALLIDNTLTDRFAIKKLFEAIERTLDRQMSKASKVSGMATSGDTVE